MAAYPSRLMWRWGAVSQRARIPPSRVTPISRQATTTIRRRRTLPSCSQMEPAPHLVEDGLGPLGDPPEPGLRYHAILTQPDADAYPVAGPLRPGLQLS